MTLENSPFQYANFISPVSITDGYTSLQSNDPTTYTLLRYYARILQLNLGSRWAIETGKVGLSNISSNIVQQSIPYNPLPFKNSNVWQFPLLSVYKTKSKFNWITVQYNNKETSYDILYIMPPLGANQEESLNPFLSSIETVIFNRTMETTDELYNNSELVFDEAGIQSISIEESTFGKIPGLNSDLFYPCLLMQSNVIERRMPYTPNYQNYAGMDGYINISNANPLGDIVNFVKVNSSTGSK